ncbi:leucine-rich repeat protein [Hepatocystis sp. ex Piliocolobus tephrosceles]|uniref:Leucine-rich repeat-containing protein 6 n=1 Tax=Piliocolobus tephrosceles TaxID=591936 RepID=A0A8C9GKV3_9PRIM|nr:leucine-rich repeat protein [Hepatocystis sp. ex Piliocolobus tephrosceles]
MKINLELIKKKSEHNEGLIEELEEIALHQLQIEKIEFINTHCKNLKILLLQNNLIEKIENVNCLKKLEYLNLALNNITLIENLEKCESLKKLDLTLNFINICTIEKSVSNLKKNENLKELYLMGNPCSNWVNLKHYVIFELEQLQVLDGCDILVSDKIKAKQEIDYVLKSLEEEKKKNNKVEYSDSINERKKMYEEIEKKEMEKRNDNNDSKKNEKKKLSIYTSDGNIRQCNEGHYKYMFDEHSSRKYTFLKIYVPKYLCNSLIKIDININYVRCIIKDKLFQIKLNDLILTDLSKIMRKKYTGELEIKLRKKNYRKNKTFEKTCSNEECYSEVWPNEQNKNVFNNAKKKLYKSILSPTSNLSFLSSSHPFHPSYFSDSSDSSDSSTSSSSVFFNNQKLNSSSYKEQKKKKNSSSCNFTIPNKREDVYLMEQKQTTYSESVVNQIPPLEKILKADFVE